MGKKKKKEIIRLEREALIPILKPKLIRSMSQQIEDESDRAEFMKLCKRIEYTIRAWYLINFEDMMYLYSFFDPIHGARKLEQQNLKQETIDGFELKFLYFMFQVMNKSNFKITSDEEVLVARSARYRLNLQIKVDETKIDKKLFSRFFEKYKHEALPAFADKYIIFRRGIGTDQTSEYFIEEKIKTILLRIWWGVLRITGLKRLIFGSKKRAQSTTTTTGELVEISSEAERNYLSVERIRIENMTLRFEEVKEVIVSYFILMQQGEASKDVLDRWCEDYIQKEFDELCNFDVDDAVKKLEKLGIVVQDQNGNYTCVNLMRANDIIGTTTEEVVLNAEKKGARNLDF